MTKKGMSHVPCPTLKRARGMTAKNDTALADQIGTSRKMIARWRERFEPREIPQTLNVEEWRKFTEDNLLGPYSAQRAYGEAAIPPQPGLCGVAQRQFRNRKRAPHGIGCSPFSR